MKMRESEIDFGGIVGVGGVLSEIEIAKKNEVIQFAGVRTIKSIWLFNLGLWGFTMLEFLSHKHNCLSKVWS